MPKNDALRLLARLQNKIDHRAAKNNIDLHLHQVANNKGITKSQLEDALIPDFNLANNRIQKTVGDYAVIILLHTNGKLSMEWVKPNGSKQKSIPAILKNNPEWSQELTEIKTIKKDVSDTFKYQKSRLNQRLRTKEIWSYSYLKTQFLNHGLLSLIAKQLIWTFKNGDKTITAMYNGSWRDVNGTIFSPNESTTVSLWHPIDGTIEDVMAWRKTLEEQRIVQPIKQAFREVYLITDAEINAINKSARMAGHLLKQHVLNRLAKQRNWTYSLLTNYDDSASITYAYYNLDQLGIRACFEFHRPPINSDYNNTGIWNYVISGHVQFLDYKGKAIKLADVPPVAFSEIMRDLDLFVAVCGVGSDPAWLEQAIANDHAHRTYWEKDAFGQLTELARTRKTVLSNLLPKLKISEAVKVDGHYVHVRGKIKNYKIHIGSGNILIQPNDQYLCIVPKAIKSHDMNKIYLPFEGDTLLSIIISKIFLLANDNQITDPSILNQIN